MVALRGRVLRDAPEGGLAVGDWVLVGPAAPGASEVVVERFFPRTTTFLRHAAGERSEPQAIVANANDVMVVTSTDGDFSVRRIERYLVAIQAGGAKPTVVFAKSDIAACAEAAACISPLARVIVTSSHTGEGIEELRGLIRKGMTAAFVGSSGVGKSALINALLGCNVQREGSVRTHDRRGRHTTTRRSLFALPGGGLIVDTPGMRELKPWTSEHSIDPHSEDAFGDLLQISALCKFSDCRHSSEPECAIREAIASGAVDPKRLEAWDRLRLEATAKPGSRHGGQPDARGGRNRGPASKYSKSVKSPASK